MFALFHINQNQFEKFKLSMMNTVKPLNYVPPEYGYLRVMIGFSLTDFFSFFVCINRPSEIRLPPKRDI